MERCALIAACAVVAYVSDDLQSAARAEPGASQVSASYDEEHRAEELYLDGIEKLAAGHDDFARQTFATVVARYPATEAARNAQRRIEDLQSGNDGSEDASSGAAIAPAVPTTAALPDHPELVDEPQPQPVRTPLWERELRRNASIQSKLRIEAGDRVFFSPGSAELGSRARMALSAQAQWLMRWHEFEAAIEGHADEPGSEQENILLSQERAEAVRQRLIEEGVEPSRLAVVPLGRSVRVATCADTECRAQNRRVITLVFATGTRERLGLLALPPVAGIAGAAPVKQAGVEPLAIAPAIVPAAATTQTAGVTR